MSQGLDIDLLLEISTVPDSKVKYNNYLRDKFNEEVYMILSEDVEAYG